MLLVALGGFMVGMLGLPLDELAHYVRRFALLPLLGAMLALALISYVLSQMLSFSLFSLLGYVEPVLLVLVALLPGEWLTYIPIWLAVGGLGAGRRATPVPA